MIDFQLRIRPNSEGKANRADLSVEVLTKTEAP